jgi:hypothetical protein
MGDERNITMASFTYHIFHTSRTGTTFRTVTFVKVLQNDSEIPF